MEEKPNEHNTYIHYTGTYLHTYVWAKTLKKHAFIIFSP